MRDVGRARTELLRSATDLTTARASSARLRARHALLPSASAVVALSSVPSAHPPPTAPSSRFDGIQRSQQNVFRLIQSSEPSWLYRARAPPHRLVFERISLFLRLFLSLCRQLLCLICLSLQSLVHIQTLADKIQARELGHRFCRRRFGTAQRMRSISFAHLRSCR